MRRRKPQLNLLDEQNLSYGGDLQKTRKGRKGARPLDSKSTLHLVLRSSVAKGEWSFKTPENEQKIKAITQKFCDRHQVKLVSLANVGNHLHFHIKLSHLRNYRPFIRAITAAIAMSVTGASRWNRLSAVTGSGKRLKFWDCRPFTRVIRGLRAFLNLRDYIRINELEGYGYRRDEARFFIKHPPRFRPRLI